MYVYNTVDGRNEYINPQYTGFTGWTLDEINEMSGEAFAALFHPEDQESVFAHMQAVTEADDGQTLEIEYRFRTKDGRWIWCLSRDAPFDRAADGSITRFIGTFLDITERKQQEQDRRSTEERLQQEQRLESLGVLAGGIAHDFNNILMAILGHAELALEDLSPVSPVRESIADIKASSVRAAELCKQLLAYSGKGRFEKHDIHLEELIAEMTHMLKTYVGKKCVLNLHLQKNLPDVHGDPSQLRQVVMNLVMNATEAIGDRSGAISIATGAMECSEEYLLENYVVDLLPAGPYVYLDISDTGCGMDHNIMQRIFEPFFTTKFTGRGLGLSAVLGIVRSHGGALRIYSEVDKGTTVKALFPAIEPRDTQDADRENGETVDWRGTGTVLLVDDEETIRTISGRYLQNLGLEVICAADGREALELFRERRTDIDFVLLDLTMPHMDGEETYRELRKIDPEVRVVLASGYGEESVMTRFSGRDLAGYLQKPYTLTRLRATVAGLLPSEVTKPPPSA